MMDSNTRLLSQGFNRLLEFYKLSYLVIKDKMKFVIKSMTDLDSRNVLQAYNMLKQRKRMLDGMGIASNDSKKLGIIKR